MLKWEFPLYDGYLNRHIGLRAFLSTFPGPSQPVFVLKNRVSTNGFLNLFFFFCFSRGADNFFRMRNCTLQNTYSKSTGGLETLQQAAVLNSKLCKIHKFTLKTALTIIGEKKFRWTITFIFVFCKYPRATLQVFFQNIEKNHHNFTKGPKNYP